MIIQNFQIAPNAGLSDFNGYLTPDALMSYCKTRLEGIDTQVQQAFAAQQKANADSMVLTNLANAIQLPGDNLDLGGKADDFKTLLHTAQQMDAAARACQDPTTQKQLHDAAATIYKQLSTVAEDKTGGASFLTDIGAGTSDADVDTIFNGNGNVPDADGKMSTSQFQTATTDAIKAIQQNANSSSELSMINLQSLMSQRQEAIQLATNLVQSLGDQCNKIAENVGH